MTTSYPTAVYFVQKQPEYLVFVGQLIKLVTLGYSLGLDVMLVTKDVPINAPAHFYHPGVWVEYSDKSVELVGGQDLLGP